METNLYRHYDANNNLLYVGISLNAVYRLSQHKNGSAWYSEISKVEIEKFETREDAIKAERKAIKEESPKHNIRHKGYKVEKEHVKKSRKLLLNNLVTFKPVYSLNDAAEVLDMSVPKLKILISNNEIGSIIYGVRNTRSGLKPIYKITGWQLIEFIEAKENENEMP